MKYIEWNIDRIISVIHSPKLSKRQTFLDATIRIDDFELRPIERIIPFNAVKRDQVSHIVMGESASTPTASSPCLLSKPSHALAGLD